MRWRNWGGIGRNEHSGRAADGKTIRGSGQERKHQAVHMVGAWVNANNLVPEQLAAEESEA
jgi:hypothetical protein